MILVHFLKKKLNKGGVLDTHGVLFAFLIPGFFASVVSGVVHATNPPERSYTDASGVTTVYATNRDAAERTNIQQGGFQIVGFCISLAIGVVTGLVVGLCMRFLNNNKPDNQFIDEAFFEEIEKETKEE